MLQNILLNALFASAAFGAAIPAGKPKKHSFNAQQDSTWQIILSGTLTDGNNPEPEQASVWDLDMFNTDASVISQLKESGKTVICYFSAGTYEPDRPDLGGLGEGDMGNELPDWPGEYWLNLKSESVLNIMQGRVQTAADKGCDAIDPDNMDGYSNDNAGGLGLSQEDSVEFLRALTETAQGLGLSVGIKNSLDIVDSVSDFVDFAVNEECAANGECSAYDSFVGTGKPVFHIEYDAGASQACDDPSLATVIKNLDLDGQVQYCDGSSYNTPTDGSSGGRGGDGGEGGDGDDGSDGSDGGDGSDGDDGDDGESDPEDGDDDDDEGSDGDDDDSEGDDGDYDDGSDDDDSEGDDEDDYDSGDDYDDEDDYDDDEDEKKKSANPGQDKKKKNGKTGKKGPRKGGKKGSGQKKQTGQ